MNICKKNKTVYLILTILLYSVGGITDALALDTFTRSQVNKSLVDIGEPCIITLSVYTETWFDQGVIFPEMRKQKGILLKKGRSYTLQEVINNKRYSIVKQEYWYYPFSSGSQYITFEDISVSSPEVGDYKGTIRKLSFKDLNIKVRPTGANWDGTVCRGLELNQKWGRTDTLNVGDVITREVTYKATGVPAAFIVLSFEENSTEDFQAVAEIPQFITKKYEYGIYGEARQKILYQVTDTGNIEVPELKAVYWNITKQRLDTISVGSKCVYVRSCLDKGVNTPQKINKETSGTNQNNMSLRIYGCIAGVVLVGIILMIVRFMSGRNHLIVLLFKIMFCHNPYHMYDLLYMYAVRYGAFDSFGDLASSMSPKLKEWYDNKSQRLFCCNLKRGISFCERLSFLYYLISAIMNKKLKKLCCFGIKV